MPSLGGNGAALGVGISHVPAFPSPIRVRDSSCTDLVLFSTTFSSSTVLLNQPASKELYSHPPAVANCRELRVSGGRHGLPTALQASSATCLVYAVQRYLPVMQHIEAGGYGQLQGPGRGNVACFFLLLLSSESGHALHGALLLAC